MTGAPRLSTTSLTFGQTRPKSGDGLFPVQGSTTMIRGCKILDATTRGAALWVNS